ncbi:hypothetical protein GDO78_020722 [Eleutherodactylus coqui]|uniref:Uncharacterized protein n=1 Tax=Eleutherodactylus coqui TaxID=57060 RepID=A0A8J6BI77_ELECQ|nr:hypothetical protein GDO78_020722 [Eleutherodactylus coqui]
MCGVSRAARGVCGVGRAAPSLLYREGTGQDAGQPPCWSEESSDCLYMTLRRLSGTLQTSVRSPPLPAVLCNQRC